MSTTTQRIDGPARDLLDMQFPPGLDAEQKRDLLIGRAVCSGWLHLPLIEDSNACVEYRSAGRHQRIAAYLHKNGSVEIEGISFREELVETRIVS